MQTPGQNDLQSPQSLLMLPKSGPSPSSFSSPDTQLHSVPSFDNSNTSPWNSPSVCLPVYLYLCLCPHHCLWKPASSLCLSCLLPPVLHPHPAQLAWLPQVDLS